MKAKTLLLFPFIVVFLIEPNLSAGPLADKHRVDLGAAIAGALTAQQVMRPFNPSGPFVEHYFKQYVAKGQVTTPASSSEMMLMKAKLLWEYGPLSGKALQFFENLNDTVFAMIRENPSLLERGVINGPGELKERIAQKIFELKNREKSFKGFQAEAEEARHSGLRLTKTKSDNRQAGTFDLYDPSTGKSYQSKVTRTASGSLNALREDYYGMPKEVRQYFRGMMPKDQIDELVAKGKLKVLPEKTQYGGKRVREYLDPDTGMKLVAHESQPFGEGFYRNARRAHQLQKQLASRPAGFGNAMVGGFIVGSVVSLAFQIYQGEDLNWGGVAQSGGIGLASSAATVILAQQIEQRFGEQLAQSFVAKNLLPGLARGSLSGAAASTVVGAVGVLGFVAKDYFTDQITAKEALIQSGIGLGSVGVGVGASVIVAWATTGMILGSEVPIIGNAAGFVVGLIGGTAFYLVGKWYYENFKLEEIRAEREAFAKTASKWNAEKMERELTRLREKASTLRAEAAKTLQ